MISMEYKDQIQGYCDEVNILYEDCMVFWEERFKRWKQKHLGINRFEKMLKESTPFMNVLKYFMVVYLQYDYISYVIASSIDNKEAYIRSAI